MKTASTSLGSLALLAVVAAGCMDSGHTMGTARDGTGGAVGGGTGGGTGGMLAGAGGGGGAGGGPDTPWTESSQRIEIDCSSYFGGRMAFRANRDQLSPTELGLLEGLRVVDPSIRCLADGISCSVSITGVDGQVVVLDALEEDE